jgi:hypothetical protein
VLVKFVITSWLQSSSLCIHKPSINAVLSPRHRIVGLRDPSPVLHSGLAVLALTREHNVVYIYKPKGMTKYARRKQREQRTVGEPIVSPIRAATE